MVKCIRTGPQYMRFSRHLLSLVRDEVREMLSSLVFATNAMRGCVYDTEHRVEFLEMVKKNG
jgi:hypothetical protein